MKSILAFISILALAAPLQAQPIAGEEVIEPSEKQLRQLRALSPASVEKLISINDDSLEAVATLTTEPVWKSKGGFTDKVRSDNFLRAFIDKRTGKVRYQLYQQVTYSGDWRRFTSVNFATADGPVAAELTPIVEEVVTCSYGICVHREVVGFDVPREVLDQLANQYSAERLDFWRFRFKGRGGLDWEDRISPAEIAGLLRAVDAELATTGR